MGGSKHTYSKSAFQAAFLYGSTMMAALLGILASMINTRFLPPEAYGDFKYVQNLLNILGCVFFIGHFRAGGRQLALNSGRSDAPKIRGALLSLLLGMSVLTVLATLVIALCSQPNLKPLYLAALLICCQPLLLSYVNTVLPGDGSIYKLSLCRFAPTLIYVIVAWLVFSRFGATPERMLILHWGIPLLLFVLVILSAKTEFKGSGEWLGQLSQDNKEYGRDMYLGALVSVGANYLAGVTLGKFSPDNVLVGYYTLAFTITYPLSMLPSIVGTTYFRKFVNMDRIPSGVLALTLLLTLAIATLFVLLIQPVVVFLYSDSYAVAGEYAKYMALAFCLHGLGEFFEKYLNAKGIGKPVIVGSVSSGAVKLAGFVALVYFWGITGALLTLTLSEATYCIILAWGYFKSVKK